MSDRDLDSDDHGMTKNVDDESSDSVDHEKVEECAAMAAKNNESSTGLAKVAKEKICAIKEIVEQLQQLLSLLLTSIQLIAEVYSIVSDLKK